MTRKEEIKQLLASKQSYERDQKLRKYCNEFILKSKVNRRLFDWVMSKPRKKKNHVAIERRQDH